MVILIFLKSGPLIFRQLHCGQVSLATLFVILSRRLCCKKWQQKQLLKVLTTEADTALYSIHIFGFETLLAEADLSTKLWEDIP